MSNCCNSKNLKFLFVFFICSLLFGCSCNDAIRTIGGYTSDDYHDLEQRYSASQNRNNELESKLYNLEVEYNNLKSEHGKLVPLYTNLLNEHSIKSYKYDTEVNRKNFLSVEDVEEWCTKNGYYAKYGSEFVKQYKDAWDWSSKLK